MPSGSDIPGGHRVQFERTAAALRDEGIVVATARAVTPDLTGVDLVHGFGLLPEQVRLARRAGARVALSTIYWSAKYRLGDRQLPVSKRMLRRARWASAAAADASRGRIFERAAKTLGGLRLTGLAMEGADVLLPNAQGELDNIRQELNVTTPAVVVPNAIDPAIFLASPVPDHLLRSGVLSVGRIEPHKNQLALIEACKKIGTPLTIVGAAHPHHLAYYQTCRTVGGDRVTWLDELTQAELPAIYDRSRVHALPSWFETTGLANLEAAARGCSIVSTDQGHAREYFGDGAEYCDPGSVEDIASALGRAKNRAPQPRLRARIAERYCWAEAARVTVEGYEVAMGS